MRILYIDIDSLRPDHLGCYGYHRNTSHHIDEISRQGVVFNQCYTPDAPCLPSRTAFYSGRFGIQTGVVGHGGTAAQPRVQGTSRGFRDWFDEFGLARQLQHAGLHTAMISPFGQRHAAHWFYAGFNEVHNTGDGGMESAEQVWPVIDKWLKANSQRDNWYLHVNLWDPHTPYRAPAEAGNPFANAPLPDWLDDDVLAGHQKAVGPHTALDVMMYHGTEDPKWPRQPGAITNREQLRRQIDGYDTGVFWADHYVGRIVAALKSAGVWDDTAVIVSADHGENQGELGIYGEHGTADAATCHVPLIIRWPGGAHGTHDDGLRYNLDLAPTLMELLNGKSPAIWDGISFANAVKSGQPQNGRDHLVISQCAHVCQRTAVWRQDDALQMYMRTYHDGFHLFPNEMLFNLTNDPHEQFNIASSEPDTVLKGAAKLQSWHDEQMQHLVDTGAQVVDPLWTVIAEGGPFHAIHETGKSPLPKYLTRLRETGRSEGAALLEQKYARWLK